MTSKNPGTVMSTERAYAYTLERVKAWLSAACNKAVAKGEYFKPIYLPDKWTADNARRCVAKMREARTRIAKWLGNSEFLERAIAYFEKQINAPAPKQAPARVKPATKEQEVRAAQMRVSKAVKNGKSCRKELKALARLIGESAATEYYYKTLYRYEDYICNRPF